MLVPGGQFGTSSGRLLMLVASALGEPRRLAKICLNAHYCGLVGRVDWGGSKPHPSIYKSRKRTHDVLTSHPPPIDQERFDKG